VSLLDPDGLELATFDELVDVDGLTVAEIGCGDGRFTFRYGHRAAAVLAVDPDEESIATAQRELPRDLRSHVRFEAANAREFELPRGEFDLALFSWSL
jgi:ubiquinone/menaquinone biosynthesis C-methylase UbiE